MQSTGNSSLLVTNLLCVLWRKLVRSCAMCVWENIQVIAIRNERICKQVRLCKWRKDEKEMRNVQWKVWWEGRCKKIIKNSCFVCFSTFPLLGGDHQGLYFKTSTMLGEQKMSEWAGGKAVSSNVINGDWTLIVKCSCSVQCIIVAPQEWQLFQTPFPSPVCFRCLCTEYWTRGKQWDEMKKTNETIRIRRKGEKEREEEKTVKEGSEVSNVNTELCAEELQAENASATDWTDRMQLSNWANTLSVGDCEKCPS